MEFDNDEKLKAINEYVKEKLSEKRYNHSIAVMNRAGELAKLYGANEKDCMYAGLIHDVAKEVPKNQCLLLAEELGVALDEIEKNNLLLVHAKIGAYIAKKRFNLSDEICDAVRTHTTACANMTLLQKIIYIGDYTSADRDYDVAKEAYKIVVNDLDEAILFALKSTFIDLLDRKILIHPDANSAYNYLIMEKIKNKKETN